MQIKFNDGLVYPLKNAKLKGSMMSATELVSRSDRNILELSFDKNLVDSSAIEKYFVEPETMCRNISIIDDEENVYVYPDYVIPKTFGTEYINDETTGTLVIRLAQLNDIDKALRAIAPSTKIYTGSDLEIAIAKKHDEIARECKKAIHCGVTVNYRQYSLTEDDQQNISVLKDLAKQGFPVPYHADGEPCRRYEPEEFLEIATQATLHIVEETTYCNLLIRYVETLESVEAVNEVLYHVTTLPEGFESKYTDIMSLLNEITF